MISSLRRRHRRMITGLTTLLPVLFLLGLMSRQPIPTVDTAGLPAQASLEQFPILLAEKSVAEKEIAMVLRLYGDRQPATQLAVALVPRSYLKYPELLVYWWPKTVEYLEQLPGDAYLLGRLTNGEKNFYRLPATDTFPEDAASAEGTLIIYNLARQQVVSSAIFPINLNTIRRSDP